MTNTAEVSVIMPVFNAGLHLTKAISSILNQTYPNFEFIIINDCSTDDSEEVIKSFTDQRIFYFKQEKNLGVVAAMNKAISFINTPLVCIMHADDIALPTRISQQVAWLNQNPQTSAVAGFINFINEKDEQTGIWKLDRETVKPWDIRKKMLVENCIAHPTLMIRCEILKEYGYDEHQQHNGFAVEDYPLWLNMLSDNYIIEKIPVPVLLYRTHTQSATSQFLRKKNPFLINYHTKKIYLQQRKKKGDLNRFDKLIALTMYLDLLKANIKNLKAIFITRKHVSSIFS
jgi:glycosyltransferase involved in cell wall biosynthesis